MSSDESYSDDYEDDAPLPDMDADVVKRKGKGRRKKKKDPNKPKGALSAYMHYCASRRPAIKAADPTLSMGDTSKKLGAEWQGLTPAQKEPFEVLAAKDKQRHRREMEDYVAPEDSDDGGGRKRKKKRARKDPNEPKKPLSAFFVFSNEHRSKIKADNPALQLGAIGKELGRRWREMTEEEKRPYQAKADQLKLDYEDAMKTYKGL